MGLAPFLREWNDQGHFPSSTKKVHFCENWDVTFCQNWVDQSCFRFTYETEKNKTRNVLLGMPKLRISKLGISKTEKLV